MHDQSTVTDAPITGGRRRSFPLVVVVIAGASGFLWGLLAGLCIAALLFVGP